MNVITGLGRYSKTIAAVVGQAIVYLQLYGTTFHLVPAATMLGVALGVYGVPNTPKPAPAVGGTLPPGPSVAQNKTGSPEPVIPPFTPPAGSV